MSPGWHRIADELRSIARDRALAASNDPSPSEARLLHRESVLLERAAGLAQSGQMQRTFTPYALDGVVTTSDDLVVWGMSASGEDALRRLADDPAIDVNAVDPERVLAAVLGARPEGPTA